MDVIFLLGSVESKVIAATADIGVAAYINEVEKDDPPEHIVSEVMFLADRVTNLTEKMHKLGVKNKKKNFKVSVSEEEYIDLLLACRTCFELMIGPPDRVVWEAIKTVLPWVSPEEILHKTEEMDRRNVAQTAHVVLDYLECYAPPNVLDSWMKHKKPPAISMFESLVEQYDDE